jgi:TonB family protein
MRNSVLATVLFGLLVHGTTAPAQDLIYASPRPTYSPAPNYPEAARTAGIQGIVAVQVQINASGAVTDARVLNGPPELHASALQTAKTWKFDPTIIAGKATSVVSTVSLTFGTPPPAATVGVIVGVSRGAATPASPPSATSTPLPTVPRPLGIVATTDGDKIIGSLKWEIREEVSGKILASGDGPVHLKDVWIIETPNPTQRQTTKTIKLTDEFVIEMSEFPAHTVTSITGFGISARRLDVQSLSWEWFNLQDSKRASKLLEGGELAIDLEQVNGDWEVTRTEFMSDVSLRIVRMRLDPPGSPPYWRIHIFKGSTITWPSIASGKVFPN